MESAENQEQPISGRESEANSDSSLSKIETIALLNDSIDRLEQTIKGLSENSAPIPSSDSINTLLTTTQELADAVASDSENESTSTTDVKTTSETIVPNPVETPKETEASPKKPVTSKKVEKVKPKSNLSLIIIGVIAIAVTIIAIFWFGLPKQAANLNLDSLDSITPEVAINSEKSKLLNEQETLSVPSIEEPIVSDNLSPDLSTDPKSSTSNSEEPVEIIIPENLESPGRAKNLKLVKIEPELDFTPEQTLIAAVMTKVGKLTQNYPGELIDSAKVNLPQNFLLVNVTDEWYKLSESRQNKVANQILKRSRQLSFDKLELKDNMGTLVARNPVIGEQIIIVESRK